MQVITAHSDKLVECFWFDGVGRPHQRGFAVGELRVIGAASVEETTPAPAPVADPETQPEAPAAVPQAKPKSRAKAK